MVYIVGQLLMPSYLNCRLHFQANSNDLVFPSRNFPHLNTLDIHNPSINFEQERVQLKKYRNLAKNHPQLTIRFGLIYHWQHF